MGENEGVLAKQKDAFTISETNHSWSHRGDGAQVAIQSLLPCHSRFCHQYHFLEKETEAQSSLGFKVMEP